MWQSFFHHVDAGHVLSVTFAGNPQGIPVLFLHGGPGAGCKLSHFDYFDLQRYWVVLFDQRGSGHSTPSGSLIANTTQALLADMESLRLCFGVERWLLFGGSWGSYLALAYAIFHPTHVAGMVLRSVCLGRPAEHRWLYEEGANALFPEAWQAFQNFIPQAERDDLLGAYYRALMSDDAHRQWQAAWHWSCWAMHCLALPVPPMDSLSPDEQRQLVRHARIEAHYYHAQLFFPINFLTDHLATLTDIPLAIVHGQQDFLCPPANAYVLHQALPASSLTWVPAAGHLSSAAGMFAALCAALQAVSETISGKV